MSQSDLSHIISLEAVNMAREKQEIELIFEKPISAGTTFTIGIVPQKNSRYAGVYLFGVTAFPRGENLQMQHENITVDNQNR
ncbi:MAG: DUF2808 domain-containing protein [Prochloraceae cyanobacterium]|nr:DUF2808 domain-containing protein [Prochloraceae cyanobacterium]